MQAHLVCFERTCRAKYAITDVLYQCPRCSSLLEVEYDWEAANPSTWKELWRERRMDNAPINQSGVWRYRELLPFDGSEREIITLREGCTPLLPSRRAGEFGGLDNVTFKHQGFNPTGSFKDNGMTCGVSQAVRLGKRVVACVSTGNTSASMAAYASAAGLTPVIFLPYGNISFGKLAQALEYGALTLQVDANFDQILTLVREIADRAGMYLLNSINPFRIEGQKTIAVELLDQLDWSVPDWLVMPGGNLGNAAAFGKGFIELYTRGFIDRMPRMAVIQAAGAAPFHAYMSAEERRAFAAVQNPETLATAIRIGNPVSWPKAESVLHATKGTVQAVSEQEIADAKAVIGASGIGCEPASAATLAGIRRLTKSGVIGKQDRVIAVLTGNVMKDPDYIYKYHNESLAAPSGEAIRSAYANKPRRVPNDAAALMDILAEVN